MFWNILESMEVLTGIEERFKRSRGVLDERARRLVVAADGAGWWVACRLPGASAAGTRGAPPVVLEVIEAKG